MKPLALVLALAAGLLLAGRALREPFEYLVVPATDANPRNSEADMLRLRNGRLLLAWTEFYTTKGSDWGPARISALFSSDQGRTWSGKHTLQENIGQMNVMEPDLLRLRSGQVLFVFCRKNSEADCRPMLRVSRDDTRTFSEPVPLPVTPYPSYTGTNHDRLVQLRSGRVLLPLWYTLDYRVSRHILTRVYYTDDEGATWKPSRTIVDLPDSKAGAQEPGVIELKDGRVLMWLRTDQGGIYRCYSRDRGETWSQPEPMGLASPLSPQSLKRLPRTGDLLLVWNHSKSGRFPLTAAVSQDEGLTWRHIRNLDEDAAHSFAYTSIEFLDDRALFTYYAGPPAGVKAEPRWSLKLKAVPLGWFYQPAR
ncbi:MAG: exo-alpha-sialidase [Acidobacteria bacterium]|nr:exo-alpha-sialidase [Acidobacteriota bacterium]